MRAGVMGRLPAKRGRKPGLAGLGEGGEGIKKSGSGTLPPNTGTTARQMRGPPTVPDDQREATCHPAHRNSSWKKIRRGADNVAQWACRAADAGHRSFRLDSPAKTEPHIKTEYSVSQTGMAVALRQFLRPRIFFPDLDHSLLIPIIP